MARTREFDPAAALDQAMEVFWDRGYAATSMDDLVKATGVSRYGIYGTFGNKRELFRAALAHYAQAQQQSVMAPLLKPDAGLPEIRECFARRLKFAAGEAGLRGCMICNAATELGPKDDVLSADARGLLDTTGEALKTALETAVRTGQVAGDLDTTAAADRLLGAMIALAVLARAGYRRRRLKQLVDGALAPLA